MKNCTPSFVIYSSSVTYSVSTFLYSINIDKSESIFLFSSSHHKSKPRVQIDSTEFSVCFSIMWQEKNTWFQIYKPLIHFDKCY